MEAEGPAHSLPAALNLGVRKPSKSLHAYATTAPHGICIETGYLCDFRHRDGIPPTELASDAKRKEVV